MILWMFVSCHINIVRALTVELKKLRTHLFSCEHLWRLLFIRRYTNGHIDWLIETLSRASCGIQHVKISLQQPAEVTSETFGGQLGCFPPGNTFCLFLYVVHPSGSFINSKSPPVSDVS